MKKILEVQNLGLTYQSLEGETVALDDISFDVEENEFISIVGPSGCGKTTMLSLIAGLIPASKGKILVNGAVPNIKENKCGYMFQKDNLFEWRNIKNNILLGLEIKHKKTKQNTEYAQELMTKYGLEEFSKHKPNQLSGGMRQRAALIRTLTMRPKILLLDEPFSALDYQTRLELCDDVSKIISEEKQTAILVTHDISEAISLSDRIIVLSKRPAHIVNIFTPNLSKYGSPLNRRECPEFRKVFETIWSVIQDEKSK